MTALVPVIFQIPSPYGDNPWVRESFERDLALNPTAHPALIWEQVIADYRGHEAPAGDCPCGGRLWYRAATGGHKCRDCQAYSNRRGLIIGITETKEDAHA